MRRLSSIHRGLAVALFSVLFTGQAFSAVANNTLNNRVIVGYQGWFGCKGDGSAANNWNHWQIKKPDGRIIPAIDIWPKMGEYTETYNNGWTLRNGSSASVFSSYDLSTVKVHFKWMQGFGIDGAFVGRQTKTIADGGNGKAFRDQVLRNVAAACETYGRVFYINYDISEEEKNLSSDNKNGNVFDRIKADADSWFGSSGFTAAQKGRYVTIGGKPVIRIFGVGSPRNKRTDGVWIFSVAEARSKLDTLNNSYTVILGVNRSWRTLDNTNIRSDWRDTQAHKDAAMLVWKQAQYMQGWTVNAFTNTAGADTYYKNVLTADIDWGKAQNPAVGIIPVIWPGFSWRNRQDGAVSYYSVPRGNGTFYWNNGYEAIKALKDKSAAVKCVTVAMFDEIDEGTAIMKVECRVNYTPTANSFDKLADGSSVAFITNVGGTNSQSDYFLWLTQQLKKNLTSSGAPGATLPVR